MKSFQYWAGKFAGYHSGFYGKLRTKVVPKISHSERVS